jgi:hypothetical protein
MRIFDPGGYEITLLRMRGLLKDVPSTLGARVPGIYSILLAFNAGHRYR